MKVKTILKQAAKCKSLDDADDLLVKLVTVVTETAALRGILQFNHDLSMEGDKPFVSFELNKEISEHHVLMVRPQIRNGALTIEVAMNRMLDGHGLQSQSAERMDDLDELIEAHADATIADIANHAKRLAIYCHAKLIERAGIAALEAHAIAKKSW